MVCLFFDSLSPPLKVVYTPQVDKFEVFHIKGLYELFKGSLEGDFTITAMSNGIRSRPVVFKKDLHVAQILNLVVVLDEGKISGLEWRNNCFDMQGCDPDQCKDTSVVINVDETIDEHNCFRSDCFQVSDNTCDTQVFLTWVGRDNDRDDCTSDNYRISAFTNFGIVSYLDSARKLINI